MAKETTTRVTEEETREFLAESEVVQETKDLCDVMVNEIERGKEHHDVPRRCHVVSEEDLCKQSTS